MVSRLFAGRLNRQNYSVGSIVITLIPFLFLMSFMTNIFALQYNELSTLDATNAAQLQTSIQTPTIASLLESPANKFSLIGGILFLILSIPYLISFQIRRLHDINRSGWWMLLAFVPLISYIYTIYVTLEPGTKEENKYGKVPLPRISLRHDILGL